MLLLVNNWCYREYNLVIVQEANKAGFKILSAIELDDELFGMFLLKYPPDRALQTAD